jgi:hypothetical protein
MKPIRWSEHAARRIARREIDGAEAELAVKRPDSILAAALNRRFYQRRYLDRVLNSQMLMRALVEETDSELVAVTLYKTSKFAKYEERGKA